MKRAWLTLLAMASLCAWLSPATGTESPPPPAKAFGTVPAIDDVNISPNGELLAWIDNSGAHPVVEIFDVNKGGTLLRMSPEGLKIRGIAWSDDETVLIAVSLTRSMQLGNGAMSEPVLHGNSDTVVPPEQAKAMLKALQGKGKSVKFVELPGEDHWLSFSDSRKRVLAEMETFLAEHLAVKAGT